MPDGELQSRDSRRRRQRAPQACLACRKRKVRCDVASRGQPCTNCSLDHTACETKRRQQRRQLDLLVTPPRTAGTSLTPTDPRILAAITGNEAAESDLDRRSSFGRSVASHDIRTPDVSDEGALAAVDIPFEDKGHDVFSRIITPATNKIATEPDQTGRPFTEWTNYPFLHAKIDLPDCDIQLLQQRGCLSIPTLEQLNELIREYFLHVHPNLPIINEADFWDTYTTSRREPIPLMLFQAMLFAACSFVSHTCIKRLGFRSLRAARVAFYNRAKTLYDLEIHTSDVCCAQTALLLTYYVSPRNPNSNSYWLTVALHHARVIHAHRYYELTHHEKANLLKRIWWACVCRDRLLSLGLRRPFQISAHDFDFTQCTLSVSDLSDEIHRSLVYSADIKRALIQLFSFQCELCVALTTGLTLLSPLTAAAVVHHENLLNGVEELVRWFEHTQSQLRFLIQPGAEHDSTVLYRNLLFIYYHSAQLALQNHALYLAMTTRSECNVTRNLLNHSVSDHIKGMTDSLLELGQRHLLGYLPITTSANIALPLAWCMIGTQVSCMEMTGSTKHPPQLIYSRAFKILQMQYEGTDQVLDYIQTIIQQLRAEGDSTSEKFTERQRLSGSPRRNRSIPQTRTSTQENSVEIYNFAHCSPVEYIRITKTLDVSLAIGRFPERTDLPLGLQTLKPGIEPKLYRPLSFGSPNELLSSTWAQTAPFDKLELDGINIESLLRDSSNWNNQSYGEEGIIAGSLPAEHTTRALEEATPEAFATAEDLGMFSGTSSTGDLDSLFPLDSVVDTADTAGDEPMSNLFSYD
ncbi:fungal-specific transcription factor domain-containing protein [Aspergillus heterothallicus]